MKNIPEGYDANAVNKLVQLGATILPSAVALENTTVVQFL
jgi:hypothetical protein